MRKRFRQQWGQALADREPRPDRGTDVRSRFRGLDRYRVAREWARLEGTPQRDLFRELRERFLDRHRSGLSTWALDVGPGPARFSPRVGSGSGQTVLMDLSREMLRVARRRLVRNPQSANRFAFVWADGSSPPFRAARATDVVVLGNALGFAGPCSERMLAAVGELVAPGGLLLLEAVAGSGEVSAYLARLPEGAVRRLLTAPVRAVLPRIRREGFRTRPERRPEGPRFRRWPPATLSHRLCALGFELVESLSVAPALGADPKRIRAVRADPRAWAHLLEIEETMGRDPDRLVRAASYLVAARRTRGIRAGDADGSRHRDD